MKRRLLLFLYSLLISTSCTREISIQLSGAIAEPGQIMGKIMLPTGIKIDTTGLQVLSSIKAVVPINSSYTIDTSGKTSTTLLLNKAGDIVLMGYNYPGQTENNLSVESTALALLMNTLTMRSLSSAGKLEIIKKIKQDAAYQILVREISTALESGKSLTDTTNIRLLTAAGSLFKSTSKLRSSGTQSFSRPITIKTSNTELLIQNNNVAHSYVAGIYLHGKLKEYHTINGRILFATSLIEAAQGIFGDGYGIPEPIHYSMSEDGEYSVKIRSGKPGADDGSNESRLARKENIYNFVVELIKDNLPLPGDCMITALEGVKGFSEDLIEKKEVMLSSAGSPQIFAAVALEITGDVFSHADEVLDDCAEIPKDSFRFLKGLGKLFAALNVAGKFMVGANITAHTNDLFQAIPAIDTCFQVIGLKTFKCGELPTYYAVPVSGGDQKGDVNKELSEPIKVKVTYEDGKPAAKTTVNWIVKSGGGKVSSTSSITSNEGIAEIKWTLGSSGGEQSIEAYINKKTESRSTVFKASAIAGAVHKIEILLNSDGGYSNPLQVKVTDINGKPVPTVEVEWRKLIKMGLNSFDRFTNDKGIAEAFMVMDDTGSPVSMEVIVKNDESKFVAFAPQMLISGSSMFYNYIQPGVDRNAMPNPVKIFFTDRYFVPQPYSNFFLIRLSQMADEKIYIEGPDQSGVLSILRPDPAVTSYKINVFSNGKTVGTWTNVIIK